MNPVVRFRAASSLVRFAVWVIAPVAGLHLAVASSTDYLFDEGELAPTEYHLSAKAERQADAMAHFITGIFEEESAGPEKALNSYHQVLVIDPGFTKLAIEVAYDYLRRGEATDAIGVLKDCIAANPGDPEPALALSSIYLRHLRKPDLATRYAESALKADPGRFAAYEALWEIAQAQGDDTACARVITRALKAKSTDTNYWLQLADFLTNSSEGETSSPSEKARAQLTTCLEGAAESAGNNADALARIGDFYVLGLQVDQAAKFYRMAAELKPALPNINERLAGALIELGRNDEAVPVLERVIAGNPLDLQAYDQLYRLYEDRGDHEKALTGVEQALIIDKTNFLRQRDLMVLLLRTGRFDTAITRAADAEKLFPRMPFFTYVRARALAALKRNDEALAAFERALVEAASNDPKLPNGPFYFDYASTAQLAGRFVKAAELFRKSIELDPRNPEAYNALGYMWVERRENLDEAERLIRKALALDPANGAFLDSLGWLHYQRGDYTTALEELLSASKALPQPDAVVFEHIGDAYRALNRTAEALLYWQKSAALDATNKPLLAKIDEATAKVAAQNTAEKR
ncbi:MAG: tetratricopeptide repeat protein [Terrimicrobiaceae bacterium]|nr:tetratricopeptide repeat protein [Terrimicrobiaceae bacterium]